MQFKLTAVFFAALAAVAIAAPSPQQGTNCVRPTSSHLVLPLIFLQKSIFFPDNCGNHGQVKCDGAGSIVVCCDVSCLLLSRRGFCADYTELSAASERSTRD